MTGPLRLVVLRHAKSAWPENVPDHDRPLGARGRRDAPAAGRWLHAAGYVPDLVVCSTARRTRETWELVRPALGGADPETVYEPRVYAAGAAGLRAVLREVPRERRTVLLVGHQPGVQDLVLSLADEAAGASHAPHPGASRADAHRPGDALVRARAKFPTSAVAVLAAGGSWADLAPGGAVLTDFAVPRGPRS